MTDVQAIVEWTQTLQPGETATWRTVVCKQTLPFEQASELAAALQRQPRVVSQVDVYRRPTGGFVAYIYTVTE